MTGKPRAKTVYIPGEGTWAWRNYSIDMRNTLLAVPKTKSGKWTQAAVRAHYFQSASEGEALRRVHDMREKHHKLGDEWLQLERSNKPSDKRKATQARKRYDAGYKPLAYHIAAFEFGYKPLHNYGPEREDTGSSVPSYLRRAEPKPKPKPKPKAPAQPRRSRGRLLTSTRPEYPRLSVRARAYRGMDGYVISGRDTINRNVSIFARTKQEANRIKRDLLAGEPVRFDNEGSITIVHRH